LPIPQRFGQIFVANTIPHGGFLAAPKNVEIQVNSIIYSDRRAAQVLLKKRVGKSMIHQLLHLSLRTGSLSAFALSLALCSFSIAAAEKTPEPMQTLRLNAKELREWLDKNPEAQRIMALPQSPERDLFISLTSLTQEFLQADSDRVVKFAGVDPRSQLYGMLYGMTDQVMSSPPRTHQAHPHPDYLGLIMQSQYIAIDSTGGQLSSLTFNRTMAGIRFILQAVGSGHHSIDDLRRLADKTEITVMNTINGRSVPNSFKASEALRVLEGLGLPLTIDGKSLAPHWRHWDSYNYKPLETPGKFIMTPMGPMNTVQNRPPLGVFHVLEEQISSSITPHLVSTWKQTWAENIKNRINWSKHLPNASNLTEEQKLEMVQVILNAREVDPTRFTKTIMTDLLKLPYAKNLNLSTKATRSLWQDALNASYPEIYDLRKTKLNAERDFAAQQEKERQQRELEAIELARNTDAKEFMLEFIQRLHHVDPHVSYISHHASFVAQVISESMAAGRIPISRGNERALQLSNIQTISELMKAAIMIEQEHNPVLKAHLEELEQAASMKLGRGLEPKERVLLQTAQAEVLGERVSQMTERTENLELHPLVQKTLLHLGLYNDPEKDWFHLYQIPHLRMRPEEPESKTLKRAASRSLNLVTTEDPSRLADYLVKRLNIDETKIHLDLYDTDLESFDLRQVQRDLKRALMVMINKNPKSPKELQGFLMDTKLLRAITGSANRIQLSDEAASHLFSQALSIMHTLSYPQDCRSVFKNLALDKGQ
jgi:hypothetical protein